MKLAITEKQLKLILSKEGVIGEEESSLSSNSSSETPSSTSTSTSDSGGGSTSTSTGSSSSQSGGTGYPQVGKWESGVTRGPANQIGNTKWSDVVGSSLKRGKSNPLT